LWISGVLALIGLGLQTLGYSQVERTGGGANAQLLQQYQQASSERNALQAENAKLKKDLDDAKAKLSAANKQLGTMKAGSASQQSALEAAQAADRNSAQSLEQTKSKMQELVTHFRETATTLREVETDRSGVKQQLAKSQADFDQCVQRNYQLYQVNSEILDHYEHQSAFSVLARAEPFTQIKRTQNENLVDEYRARAEELRLQRRQGATTAPGSK